MEENQELDVPKLLYRADDAIEASMYLLALGKADIPSRLVGGQGSITYGELGADAQRVDVFVGEADLAVGRQVIEDLQASRAADSEGTLEPWTCPSCTEEVERNFDACWNCGTARKGEA